MSIDKLGNLGSNGKEAAAASHYYSERSADYYLKGSTSHDGLWIGQGSARLGLAGGPDREQLQLALAGYLAGRKVQNAGRANRQMGWDLTFSAPKSVSLAWAFAAPAHQLEILRAHQAAAKVAHDYVESKTTTRRGKGGRIKEPAYLASALFTHYTSREGDPQLHSHVVIPNFCVRSDGTIGTLKSEPLYHLKLTAGALYQAELAARMRVLGYGIESEDKGTFRLLDVHRDLEQQFSKRSKEINRLSKERGIRTYKGTRKIVLSTRPTKKHTTLAERQAFWQKEAEEAGLSISIERHAKSLTKEARDAWMRENVAKAGQKLTDQNSVFFEKDHLREIARASYGILNAQQVQRLAAMACASGRVVELGKNKEGHQAFTTPEMSGLERGMMDLVRKLAEKKGYEVDASKAISDIGYLSDEQQASVLSTTGRHGISVIQGRAGAGKTTTLSAIRGSYERAGWKVQGLALSGQAALTMEKESGIRSKTIASWKKDPLPEPKTVLVIDEAGMVGSRSMRDILQRADKAGSKVILVGDERQLQPIEAGGALHAVDVELINVAPGASSQIQTIRRQKEEWMRNAVHDAAIGRTAEALKELDVRGKITMYASASVAKAELIKEYLGHHDSGFERSLILTHRKGDSNKINDMVREELQARNLVSEDKLQVHNSQRNIDIAIGDRLMFTKNDYRLGVRNGQRGAVKSIDEKSQSLVIRTDEGEEKAVSIDKYKFLEYGWASTTHKAQGATVDRAYVFGHTKESMASQQMTYVQISRAREEAKIYAVAGERSIERPNQETAKNSPLEKTEERAKAFKEMTRTWSRDAAKNTSLEFLQERLQKQNVVERSKGAEIER